MTARRLPAWVFLLPAVLFVLAGLVPLYRERPVNVIFIAVGALWLVIGLAMVRSSRKASGEERDSA